MKGALDIFRLSSEKRLRRPFYEGLLRTKYRICIYPCYVAYVNAMRNKSISKHVRYKLKVSDKTKRCLTQLKDAW